MFSSIPFLKLVIVLAAGIVGSVFFGLQLSLFYVVVGLLILFSTHLLAHQKSRIIPLFGLVLLAFIFLVGVYRGSVFKNIAHTKLTDQGYVVGKILKPPKVFDNFVKTDLEIVAVKTENGFEQSEGQSLLMLENDSLACALKKGDYIQFEPNFKEIESQNNPETFNYKRYLFFHLISQQTYLKSNHWNLIEHQKHWFDIDQISTLRQYLLSQYKKYGIEDQELAVLSALTLGYKNDLDYSIQKSYAASGAIHVLAVSGLHVGIVYVIISYLLKFVLKFKKSQWVRFGFTLIFIWFFALLTGATPSVLRASLMFSFMALGQAIDRKNSTFNSIFASAFFLLLYNPFLLFDLSFQLSYSAVISIVYFQPLIYNLIPEYNSISKWIWGLISVSLAAQIGTVPITLFYFHQFPNYFLLSNFIVIPGAIILIWGSVLFFMVSGFEFFGKWIAFALDHIISFQNYLIQQIESWPFALSQNLYIDTIQLSILVFILLIIMQLIYKPKFSIALILGLSILLFSSYTNYQFYQNQKQRKLIVYQIKGQSAINFIDGKDNILLSSLNVQSKQKDYVLKQNWMSLGLENEKHLPMKNLSQRYTLTNIIKSDNPHYFAKNNFIQFYNQRILVIQDKSILSQFKPHQLSVDYVIVAKNTRIDLSELKLYFKFKQVIIDSSHSPRNIQYWKTQKAIYPSVPVYIVGEQGAFIRDLI